MKIYVITDTHLGHDRLVELGQGRPTDFMTRILHGVESKHGDLLIHLGDICIGHDGVWNSTFMAKASGFKKKILVRGNHDNKSYAWYYAKGWDAVVETMRMRAYGKEILFTHMPVLAEQTLYSPYVKLDHNVHGHLHGRGKYSHRAIEGYQEGYHIDAAPDLHGYAPINLERLLCK